MKAFLSSFFIFIFVILLNLNSISQNNSIPIENSFKIMFYNCENLFDTNNDSLINDEEFLPEGERFWTKNKYYNKIRNTYKVIMAVGGWNPPAIIGL